MRHFVIAAALAASASPSLAQDAAPPTAAPTQTLEGARQFLAKVLPGQRAFSQNINWNDDHIDVDNRMERFYGVITSFDASDPNPCKIKFTYQRGAFSYNGGDYSAFTSNSWMDASGWGAITSTTTRENSLPLVDVTMTGRTGHWGFIVIPETLEKRVAYALDYMRLKCDKTGGTGF